MPDSNLPADDEVERALGEHQVFVMRLAQRLVDSAEDAEDLAQDTWMASLQAGRPPGRKWKAWVTVVARNRWRRTARREGERRSREREGARPEWIDPEEAELGLELRQRVIQAVRSLPQPYLTTIYMRYYEERSIADVAARMGVPPETARSRIQRAIMLLREKLDRQHGSRAAWLTPLASWEHGSGHGEAAGAAAQAARIGGGFGVLPLVTAAGAVVLIVALQLQLGGVADAPAPPPAVAGGLPAGEAAVVAGPREAAVSAETGAPSGDAAAGAALAAAAAPGGSQETFSALGHTRAEYTVRGRVLGPRGQPLADARVHYGHGEYATDTEGRFEAHIEGVAFLRGESRLMAPLPLIAVAEGHLPVVLAEFSIDLPEDEFRPLEVELVLPGLARSIGGRVLTADGAPAAGWSVALRDPSLGVTYPTGEHVALETLISGAPVLQELGTDGRFRFEGLLARAYSLIAWEPETLLHVVARVEEGQHGDVVLVGPDPAASRVVSGVVRSGSGAPLEGARVSPLLVVTNDVSPLHPPLDVRGRATTTDAAGAFRIEGGLQGALYLGVEADALLRPWAHELLPELDWSQIEISAFLRVEVVLDQRGERPLAEMLAFLDAQGERVTMRVSEEDRERMGGLSIWRALPLGPGPSRRVVHSREDAVTALFYDRDGTEIARWPLHASPERPTTLTW